MDQSTPTKDPSFRDGNSVPGPPSFSEDCAPSKGTLYSHNQTTPLEGADSTAKTAGSKITELLKGKEKEWTAVASKKGPLKLLDLPLDILDYILKEVSRYRLD